MKQVAVNPHIRRLLFVKQVAVFEVMESQKCQVLFVCMYFSEYKMKNIWNFSSVFLIAFEASFMHSRATFLVHCSGNGFQNTASF